jgi:hypothetical protein
MMERINALLTWILELIAPKMCKEEGHWTVKLFDLFFVDCQCCLFYRGMTLGFIAGVLISSVVSTIL